LYGGRAFNGRQISDADIDFLYKNNMGIRIPMSSSIVEPGDYEACRFILEKYQRKGNSIIATDDNLAKWIRRDFPLYNVEASVIKDITTQEGIDKALELYDTVVLPMWLYDDLDALNSFKQKDKITLFGNGGCAYNCPAKICYKIISKGNKFKEPRGEGVSCSKKSMPRPDLGIVEFDIPLLYSMGYKRFKLLRPAQNKQGVNNVG
jgi:hypothetical protein